MQHKTNQYIVKQDTQLLNRLAEIMSGMISAHQELLKHLAARREAMRSANMEQFEACRKLEEAVVLRIATLDEERQAVVAALVSKAIPATYGDDCDISQSISITEISQQVSGQRGSQLTKLSSYLRSLIQDVQHETKVVRSASEALLAHISMLAQKFRIVSTRTSLYGRDGKMGAGPALVRGIDVQT